MLQKKKDDSDDDEGSDVVAGSEDEFDALVKAGPVREKTARRAATKVIIINYE